jgi:MFS family permease
MLVRFFQSRNIYYGWVVLVVTFITMFFVMGFRFAFGVYYVAILEDTGWQRAETAGIFSTAMVVYGIFSIVSGALFDWLGPRILFPAGCMLLGIALLLCSTITTLWQFYLYYGVLVGISYSMVGFITHMAYIPRWFVKNRGLTTSLALSGIGAGALIISILSEALLETLGWRSSFALAGITMIVFLVPLTALFHRDSPQSIGLHPDGRAEAAETGPALDGEGVTLSAAVRMPAFWLLFASVTSIGMGNMTMVVHQTRLLVDKGFTLSLAAALLGITGFLRSFGGMVWGYLSDRIGRGPCIWAASVLGVAGLVLLKSMDDTPNLLLVSGFVLLWGMGYLAISPLYAATAADLFQGKHLGKILGTLDQGFGLGAASGPYLAGLIFDRYGSYDLMISMMMGGAILTGITLWAAVARTPHHR